MPIIRYLVFVGGLLLALLYAAGHYLPAPVEPAAAADPNKTIIRISSARSLPEKIVFDTRPRADVPTSVPADTMTEEGPREHVREAVVALPATPPAQVKKEPRAHFVQARPHPKRLAKSPTRAPDRRLAFDRHDPFAGGWW